MSPIRSAVVITLATLALLCSCGVEDGNGFVSTQERQLRSFDRVEVTDGLSVTVVNGEQRVLVTTDEDLQNNIVTDVDGSTLHIRRAHNEKIGATVLQIQVSAPALHALTVKDRSSVTATATATEEWRLHVENESNVVLTNVSAARFVAHITDRARAQVSGSTVESFIDVHDSSVLEANELSASKARIDISGQSQASLNATSEIEIDSAGNSRVIVSGNPGKRNVAADNGSEIVFSNQ